MILLGFLLLRSLALLCLHLLLSCLQVAVTLLLHQPGFYRRVVGPLLLWSRIDPETAHHLTIFALKWLYVPLPPEEG